MAIKGLLYLLVTPIVMWCMESINLNLIFKKNRYYKARVCYLLILMALSYLVVNFIYDLFINTKFIN